MNAKYGVSALLLFLLISSAALGESAHKGWGAREDTRNEHSAGPHLKLEMRTPFVDIRKPDPEANCAFRGGLLASKKEAVEVKRLYLLSTDNMGVVTSKEVSFAVAKPEAGGMLQGELRSGEHAVHFETAKVHFKSEDIFAVVLMWNGKPTVRFLRIQFGVERS